jgi:hypothetical protein
MAIAYPLTLTFKLIALSPEVQVRDANDTLLLQVKQKLLTLREDTTVFADEQKTVPIYKMIADRIIGFRAVHHITRVNDNTRIGNVKAQGFRSWWAARYEITDGQDRLAFNFKEENPWITFLDYFFESIELIGWLFAYFINPTFVLIDEKGVARYRILKKRSLIERRFFIEQIAQDDDADLDERLVALSLIQIVMLERRRG